MDKHNSTDTSATAQRAVASGPLVRRGVFSRERTGWMTAVAFLPLFLFGCMLTAERWDETLAQWTLRNFGRPFLDEPNTGDEARR